MSEDSQRKAIKQFGYMGKTVRISTFWIGGLCCFELIKKKEKKTPLEMLFAYLITRGANS